MTSRIKAGEQDPKVRAHNFGEVNLGFTLEQARQEAADMQAALALLGIDDETEVE